MSTCAVCPNETNTKFCSQACKSKFYRSTAKSTARPADEQSTAQSTAVVEMKSTDTLPQHCEHCEALEARLLELEKSNSLQRQFLKQRFRWLEENIPVSALPDIAIADLEERLWASVDKRTEHALTRQRHDIERAITERVMDSVMPMLESKYD